ncbi:MULTISPECIES: hypothetical protein [Bacillus cereus group]|uniref:Uncharacterized protein n=1 Tax=Bacillus thuringiensis serovar sooncheon TaxID=180891 RepID=A0A9Q5SFA1_BACTU|nr:MULTISPECIES: hypothetical protein [Bacillus cereus group]OTW66124.1 hypothetical protein BK707_25910 [Bacillus thuringiensis serovar coreanensis]OTX43597.1 hypothetical protein BK724_22580 [Bacillus thuringiensis serovar sooncheon]OTX51904.1 hypothetical protein BK725_22025 [Bacillus thuringiensis serovar guiyangiensis]OTX70286.1 hypothetical protein BK727_09515 [Bacillus thuringiensis serovar roskildiensis]
MSVKKKTQVRTGKMVRELMLADEDVNASLIMVYSENGVNAEIKIEGLTPKCNEELFLSGNVDWNKSVIYKIVDFTGNAEVGKVTLTAMNKNNVSLEVERVMWSKENKEAAEQEETVVEATPKKEIVVEAPKAVTPAPKSVTRVETPVAPKPTPVPTPKPVSVEAAVELSTPAPVKKAVPTPVTKQETAPVAPAKPKQPALTETNTKLQENYVKLVKKTIEVCQDYELGIDIDDSIEGLKQELQSQGISVTFDKEIMDVVNRLRSLQDKGIKVEKVLNLL